METAKINFAAVQLKFAGEAHKTPKMEVYDKKYVLFGTGKEWYNNFPGYLIDLMNRSPKHNAIITGKVHYLKGKGWNATGQMKTFVEAPNRDEDLETLAEKIYSDFELFDGFYLEAIWNKPYTKVSEVRHLPFQKMRTNLECNHFWFSEKFSNGDTPKNNDVIEFEKFIAGQVPEKGKRYVIYYKAYRPGTRSYPLPNYMGALSYIEVDVEISNFHLNNIKNNFWGGKAIEFTNGRPSEEERRAIEQAITDTYTGSDNAGRMLVLYSDGKDKGVNVHDLQPSELDKQFNQLNLQVQQEIFTGHKVTSPMLFGVKTEGQLGGRTELLDANLLFNSVYIAPRQKTVTALLEKVASTMGYSGTLEALPSESVLPQFSDSILQSVMTTNEIRKSISLDPINLGAEDDVMEKLNVMAPRVSAEALNVMTVNEIRELIGKNPIAGGDRLPTIAAGDPMNPSSAAPVNNSRQLFKHDTKKLISLFKKYGQSRSEFEVLKTNHQWDADEEKALMQFATKLSDTELAVLDQLIKSPELQSNDIAAALNVSIEAVQDAIASLKTSGQIKSGGDGIEVTPSGKSTIENNQPSVTEITVVYHYDVAPGLGAVLIDTSRDFCKEMVNMNKVYSRFDIENISQEYGYSVWELRGGFYHNPQSDETTPYCRHIWTQEIVTKKIS